VPALKPKASGKLDFSKAAAKSKAEPVKEKKDVEIVKLTNVDVKPAKAKMKLAKEEPKETKPLKDDEKDKKPRSPADSDSLAGAPADAKFGPPHGKKKTVDEAKVLVLSLTSISLLSFSPHTRSRDPAWR
jgi:hypothetical protein